MISAPVIFRLHMNPALKEPSGIYMSFPSKTRKVVPYLVDLPKTIWYGAAVTTGNLYFLIGSDAASFSDLLAMYSSLGQEAISWFGVVRRSTYAGDKNRVRYYLPKVMLSQYPLKEGTFLGQFPRYATMEGGKPACIIVPT